MTIDDDDLVGACLDGLGDSRYIHQLKGEHSLFYKSDFDAILEEKNMGLDTSLS